MAAISDLLGVKIPSSYEVSSTPDRGSLSMLGGPRVGPHGMEPRPPMLFHGQGDNGVHHGRPDQMIRPIGIQGMMQHQQAHHFRFHPNSPGEGISLNETRASLIPQSTARQLLIEMSCLI